MIETRKAIGIEERLASMLEISVDELRDYMRGNIRAGSGRRTGVRFVRGSHSGTYIRDPEGNGHAPAGLSRPVVLEARISWLPS